MSTSLAQPLIADIVVQAISWRRHLHAHPELAFKETQTADFIAAKLEQFGLRVRRGLGGTGVVGTLSRGTNRRAIAIRADMDALPIQEQSGAAHASRTPNVMHACGHDGHVAMALAAARICSHMLELDGTVHFIFQPAEEAEGGAHRMIQDGLFRLFPCDAVYALHNWPALPIGTIVAREGAMMAALAVFEISVTGRGCHGAMPHQGVDPVYATCQIVSALQSIVSRNVDPLQSAVVSVTQIQGGDTCNVIPDRCFIRGTTRWFDQSVGDLIEQRMEQQARLIAASLGCESRFHYERRYPAVINNSSSTSFIRSVATSPPVNLSLVDANPTMGSEDFAAMLQAVPGCYFWLGAGDPHNTQGLHSARYDFNDELLSKGVELWVNVVRRSLAAS